jgi:hypothetical protein
MGRGVKIPRVGGSIYHGLGGQHSMGRMVKMQWIGVQYNMGRGVKLSWVGGLNPMDRGSKYHG